MGHRHKLWMLVGALAVCGACLVLLAILAPQLHFGEKENFLLYRLAGLDRRTSVLLGAGFVGAALLLVIAGRSLLADRLAAGLQTFKLASSAMFRRAKWTVAPSIADSQIHAAPAAGITTRRQREIAVVLTLIAVGVFFVLSAVPRVVPPAPVVAMPEVIAAYDMVDGSRYVQVHGIAVLFIALSALFAGFLGGKKIAPLFRFELSVPPALGAAILLLPLVVLYLGVPHSYLLPGGQVAVIALIVAGLLVYLRAGNVMAPYVAAICGCYVLYLMVVGFVGPIILSEDIAYHLAQFETHLAELILPSSVAASGFRLIADLSPGYGLMASTLIAIFERHVWMLDVGGQIRVAQISQVFFMIAAVTVLYRIRHRLTPMLLPLVMTAPYLTTASLYIWHPNETGIRSLGFPLGLLVLQWVNRLGSLKQAMVLGAAAAFFFISNVETGIAIAAGFAFYVYQRSLPITWTKIAVAVGGVVGGMLMIVCVFDLVVYFGLGYFITPSQFLLFVSNTLAIMRGRHAGIALYVAGPANLNLIFLPVAFIMLSHSLYLVVLYSVRARARGLSQTELFAGSTATILVVWLGYYFNFSSPWNMWVPMFLYGSILTALYDEAKVRMFFVRPFYYLRRPWIPFGLMFIFCAVGVAHKDLAAFVRQYQAPPWTANDPGMTVSGVLVSTKLGPALLEKARYLKEQNQQYKIAYTTLNSDFMPVLSGVYQVGPQRNLWLQIHSEAELQAAIQNLSRRGLHRLLTDDTAGPLAQYGQRLLYQQHVERIVSAYFSEVDKQAGWKIWVPKR